LVLTSNHYPEMTTMTDDSIVLRELLGESADADLLREMIGFAAERLMELEVQGLNHRVGPVDCPALVERCEFGSHGLASPGKPVIVLSLLDQPLHAAQLLHQRLSHRIRLLGPGSTVT
jgi:hypothetical protein